MFARYVVNFDRKTFYEREEGEVLSRDQIYSMLNAVLVEADLDYG